MSISCIHALQHSEYLWDGDLRDQSQMGVSGQVGLGQSRCGNLQSFGQSLSGRVDGPLFGVLCFWTAIYGVVIGKSHQRDVFGPVSSGHTLPSLEL